jgi:ferritin-like protein
MSEYPVLPFLIKKGFDRSTAEQISEELGLEEPEDISLIRKVRIYELGFLTRDQQDKLWSIVRATFAALPEHDKNQIRENHRLIHHCDRTETSMSNLLIQLKSLSRQ